MVPNSSDAKFVLTQTLLSKRRILLEDDVDESAVKKVLYSIEYLNAIDPTAEIELLIHSVGGGVSAGLQIYYILVQSEAPVIGYVKASRCSSIATVILQGCKKRIMYKYSSLLIHSIDVTRNIYELLKPSALENSKKLQDEIEKIFVERTKFSSFQVKKIMEKGEMGESFGPNKAFGFGLVDEVI